MSSLVTLRRHAYPLLERRILDWFSFFPLLGALRPTHFGTLVTRVTYGVIRNCVKPAFLLGKAENMAIDPSFQAQSQRPALGRLEYQLFFAFEKSRNTFVENLDQPIRNAILHFQNRAYPQGKLLPVDVLHLE